MTSFFGQVSRYWRDKESNPKILPHFQIVFLPLLATHIATLKIERKVSHLNIAFDRYAS